MNGIPSGNVLMAPLTTQEAVLSSKIEGTEASFGEVLQFEATGIVSGGDEKAADIHEVLNYRTALKHAGGMLKRLPLSGRVVKSAHGILMQGVRGQNKTPGEYRNCPNWIGAPGSTIERARFIPLSSERVPDAMSAWEKYLHEEGPDALVQLAILHAEFEAIHPFMDGNGRLGRLLIPLYLTDKKLLSNPNFYMSAFLERHRDEYYDRLLAVSRDDDWTGWCVFFLTGMIEQAKENETRAKAILELYRLKKDWILELTHSRHAMKALDWFFARPIFATSAFVASAGIPKPTAHRILKLTQGAKLLRVLRPASGRRAAILAFGELLNIAEGRKVF